MATMLKIYIYWHKCYFGHGDSQPTNRVNLVQVCSLNIEQSRLLQLIPSRMGQGGEKTLPGLRVSKCWKLLWETTGSGIIGWLLRCLPQAQRLHCNQLLRRLCLRQVQRMHFPKMLFSNAPAQPIWHPRFLLQGIQRQGQGRWGILTPEYLSLSGLPTPTTYYVFYAYPNQNVSDL